MSLVDLAGRLRRIGGTMNSHLDGGEGMRKALTILETEIKSVIGTAGYNWPPLAASTVARKGSDTPLLDKGVYRDSFTHILGHREGWVGTGDFRAHWLEWGTSRMAPRPVLPGAWNAKEAEVRACFSGVIAASFKGGR